MRWGLIPAHAGKTPRTARSCAGSRAHPRSRGENCVESPRQMTVKGSSPLTRGKRFFRARLRVLSGLIPAHAGKTSVALTQFKLSGAHPRSRGENAEGSTHCAVARGSSPLTRGKRKGLCRRRDQERLIPAHAGKTRRPRRRGKFRWAHPRSRGENLLMPAHMPSMKGSSPLTRGKRNERRMTDHPQGLIPAHAGKTRDGVLKSMSIGAHPRSRGEN